MRKWAIYYADGTVYDSDDGPFNKAPVDGVIVIVWPGEGDNVDFLSDADYYIHFAEDGTIERTEDAAAIIRSLGYVKCGATTSRANFNRIMNRARDDWRGSQGQG